jgi:hypothetical protein
MRGKIFAESSNLYQDEARVLFDYYKKAAEKIVKEEMELEKSIDAARAEITRAEKDKKKGVAIIAAFCAVGFGLAFPTGGVGVFFALGAIWGVVTLFKAKKSKEENETKIIGFEEAYRDIRRNYRVQKLGVVYVPVAAKVPFEDKSFIVDHTGQTPAAAFKMSVARKPEELLASLDSLEKSIREAPLVEAASSPEEIDTSQYSTSMQHIKLYDYLGNIDRQVRNIRYLLNDNDTIELTLPVIMPESETAAFLSEYGTNEPEDKPVVNVFDTSAFKEKIETFYKLNESKKSFEKSTNENQVAYFKKLIGRLAESVHILSKTKTSGAHKMIDYANMIFSGVLKSAFNQYSPALEAEEIERIRQASFDYQDSVDDYTPFSLKSSSRVKYDLFSGSWIAEDQSRTALPFGMHQIQEEVLAPVIQNLMQENRIERLKIYNNIKDQKIDYLNQWHRDTEDFYGRNRAEAADLINRMRESYADYVRALNTYKALQETQIAMQKSRSLDNAEVHEQNKDAEIIAGFEMQAQIFNQKQEDFSAFMDRIKENIDERAAEFGYIPYYEATLRDKECRDIAQSAESLRELDPRRKKLISISPYVAKYAKLPPAPQVEQQLYDDFDINLLNEAARTENQQTELQKNEVPRSAIQQSEIQENGTAQDAPEDSANEEN